MVKYFLHVSSSNDSAVLGLICNPEKRTFTIGGYTRFEDTMENLIDQFFPVGDSDGQKKCERRLTQRNKVKFVIKDISATDCFRILSEMRKANLTLQRTTRFEKLMR